MTKPRRYRILAEYPVVDVPDDRGATLITRAELASIASDPNRPRPWEVYAKPPAPYVRERPKRGAGSAKAQAASANDHAARAQALRREGKSPTEIMDLIPKTLRDGTIGYYEPRTIRRWLKRELPDI
jgi:hypothetical protein